MLNIMLNVTPAIEVILSAIAVGLAGLIGLGFARLNAFIAAKTKDVKMKEALLSVSNVVETSVQTVQQTFVDQLKKDGKFNKENQMIALRKAMDLVLANITAETRKQVEVLYPDFENWLRTQIESTIYSLMPKQEETKKVITG